MGNLSLKDKAYFLISWILVLLCSAAEQDYYFHDWRNLTWEEARNHCQVCFKELVTVTPENIRTISQNLSSDCWVGLRKNFYSTSTSSMPWSRWADGEPLIFQNWYPGWPMFKSSFPKSYSCSCPARVRPTGFTTPDVTSFSGPGDDTTATDMSSFTSNTTDQTVTDLSQVSTGSGETTTENPPPITAAPMMPAEADCVLSLDFPETDVNYIEDSCVAMLSFGAWVEKNCSELLSFICYEDRFIGHANVTKTTSESAILQWQPGPGNISHYRIEVEADGELTQHQTDELTYRLSNLTAGTHHSVQVFPVKCNRDLNPQEITFYTTLNKLENLTVVNVTETAVLLRWDKPARNVDFYLITVQGGKQIKTKREAREVSGLTPGSLYSFTVVWRVSDHSPLSEESNITAYTKPGKVSNLRVTHNTNNSLQLQWKPPEGKNTGFLVKAMDENYVTVFGTEVNGTDVRVTGLPMGAKITCSVTALTDNGTLEGDNVTVISYTVPGPVSNLTLVSTHDSLNATWTSSASNSSSFTVELQLQGKNVDTVRNLKEPRKHFDKLKTAAKYTVIVYTVSGHVKGLPVESSKFTSLLSPSNVSVIFSNKTHITLRWTAPDNTATARYSVRITSSFWGHSWSDIVENKTSHTFGGLKSGTRYDLEVQAVVDGESSPSANASHCTVPEKREISLSMLCSSDESLLCDKNTTRDYVFNQLHKHFFKLLGDNIFWELQKQETENK